MCVLFSLLLENYLYDKDGKMNIANLVYGRQVGEVQFPPERNSDGRRNLSSDNGPFPLIMVLSHFFRC